MRNRLYVFFLLLHISIVPTACAQATAPEQLFRALLLEHAGHPDKAITILTPLVASASTDEAAADEAAMGQAWNILGLALKDQGNFSDSQRAFERALQILKRSPAYRRHYAMALDNFGGLLMAMDQPDAARSVRTKALDMYKQSGDHAGMAVACSDLAGIAFGQGSRRSGKKYLRQARNEAELAIDLSDDNRAAIFSMQAWLALLEGDAREAVVNYQRSLDLWKKQYGDEHPFTGWGYVLLGSAKAREAEPDAALADIQKGVAILGRTAGRLDSRYLKAQIAYAELLDRTAKNPDAVRMKADAEQALRSARQHQCLNCTVSAAAFR